MTNGHALGANEVLVGHQACLGHGGRHTTWTCRTVTRRCTGHRSTSTAGQGLSPGQRLCPSPRRRSSTPTACPSTCSADRRHLAALGCRTPSLGCCACATSPRLTPFPGCWCSLVVNSRERWRAVQRQIDELLGERACAPLSSRSRRGGGRGPRQPAAGAGDPISQLMDT